MSGGHDKKDKKGQMLLISGVVYATIIIGAIALAPLTEGRSLSVICFTGAAMAIHGLLYVVFS